MTDAYRFIAAEKANYPISLMSRMLGVSRQAFHAWERRPPSQRALEGAFLTERIREIHRGARGVYGARRRVHYGRLTAGQIPADIVYGARKMEVR